MQRSTIAMIGSAFVFLAIAIVTAIIGAVASWGQGIPAVMFWLATVSLAIATGFLFAHAGRYDPDQ
jgi:uncharacterized protein involved in cysteine biosynthesis